MKRCPCCTEVVIEEDEVCPWCHAPLGLAAAGTSVRTNGKAIASLICGIFFLLLPAAILAVILGHIARSEVRRSQGRLSGSGMAMGGLILGYSGIALPLILIILLAIALPNLIRSHVLADEASAIGTLRSMCGASTAYASTYRNGYPPSLAALGPPAKRHGTLSCDHSGIISGSLASGRGAGYVFSYVGQDTVAAGPGCTAPGFRKFLISADPISRGVSGRRSFLIDPSGIIHYNARGAASMTDPVLH